MTMVRTIPAHEIVRRTFPRPEPTERERVAMASGKAIDEVLARAGYELRSGRRPSVASLEQLGRSVFEEELEAAAVEVRPEDLEKILAQLRGVVRAYRSSEIAGLARPKSRVVLLNGEVGIYAQPDYWDGRRRFFEMKSYRAVPPPPDVELQLRLFQLAFPGFEAVLLCLDRHAEPVAATSCVVPAPTGEQFASTLRLAYDLGRQYGEAKVLEYLEGPFVHYRLAPAPEQGSGVSAIGGSTDGA